MQAVPTVSIIIPVHNVWNFTKQCLDSVVRYSGVQIEIIVIDDASGDETPHELLGYQSILGADTLRIITNTSRGNYSKNNNAAAALAKGEYLCLLNNDTIVTPYWLEPMVTLLQKDPSVGIVGNKHLFPDSRLLNHCGIAFDAEGHPWHISPNTDPEAPAANFVREVPALTFACVMMRKGLFAKLGGLDERYENGYEDCDFSLKVRKAGLKVLYTPASTVYHYGQSSPGRTDKNLQNYELFKSVWEGAEAGTLESITGADRIYNEASRAIPNKRDSVPDGIHMGIDLSGDNAFSWAAAEIALALDDLGEKVSVSVAGDFASGLEPEKKARLRQLVTEAPKRSCHIKLSHYWDHHFRQIIHGDVNVEFFCANYRFQKDRHLDPWSKNLLLNGYKKLSMSSFNREVLLDLGVPAADIHNVPLGYAPEIDTGFSDYVHAVRKDPDDLHMFVVTNSHDLYRYGTDILVKVFAEAFTKESKVVLHIKDYGKGADDTLLREWIAEHPDFPRIVWHKEFLSKADLLKLYTQMDVLVCPYRGEGFGLKIIDAMALGVPVMMPAFGGPTEFARPGTFIELPFKEVPVGECYDTKYYRIGDGAYWAEVQHDSFVTILKDAVDRRETLETVGAAGRKAVRGIYTWENTAQKLSQAIKVFSAEREEIVASRRRPSLYDISVIIPTKDRNDVLLKALQGYTEQTLEKSRFEIVIVNDYGDLAALQEAVSQFASGLAVRVLDNEGKPGPASARNLALSCSKGRLVFITGDDQIPSPHVLEKHLGAHAEFPLLEAGFVGYTPWHPEAGENWFMRHIIGEGGQQFSFSNMSHGQLVSYEKLYTSNVSFKRDFLIEQEPIFSTAFPDAAFEDIELGYRLHFQGMELRYLSDAIVYHLHPMTLDSFLERQRRVGKMLAVLCTVQPSYVSRGYLRLIDTLEYERRKQRTHLGLSADAMFATMREQLRVVEQSIDILEKERNPDDVGKRDQQALLAENITLRKQLFNGLSELMVRIGVAEGWAQSAEDAKWAGDFVCLSGIRGMFARSFSSDISPGDEKEMRYLTEQNPTQYGELLKAEAFRQDIAKLQGSVHALQEDIKNLQREVVEVKSLGRNLQQWITEFSIMGRAKAKLKGILGGKRN